MNIHLKMFFGIVSKWIACKIGCLKCDNTSRYFGREAYVLGTLLNWMLGIWKYDKSFPLTDKMTAELWVYLSTYVKCPLSK